MTLTEPSLMSHRRKVRPASDVDDRPEGKPIQCYRQFLLEHTKCEDDFSNNIIYGTTQQAKFTHIRANLENYFGQSVYFFKWDVLVSRGGRL